MEVIYSRCCGLDVHKKTVVACLRVGSKKEIRSFGTTTEQLRAMATWLDEAECTQVAMESTGVYWKPVVNVLELSGMDYSVVNARHMKAVPGRKTDVNDAEWLCDLTRHGLVRASFIPDRQRRELQELVRYRRSLINDRTREVNRIHKLLEGANIKLTSVVTDVMGVSGRAMLQTLARGETDPMVLAQLANTHIKAPPAQIRNAVDGFMGKHQRKLLVTQLSHIDLLNRKIAGLDKEVDTRLRSSGDIVARLKTIPGIGKASAQELIAAIGTDMSRFPSAAHLASWAKVCPGANESAGKRKPARTGRGNPFLRSTLIEAAQSAARTKDTYLRSQYYRIKARRGANKATVAVAHSILTMVYHIIKDETSYLELGADYFDRQRPQALSRQLVHRLTKMGFTVTIEPATKPAA